MFELSASSRRGELLNLHYVYIVGFTCCLAAAAVAVYIMNDIDTLQSDPQ